MDAGRFCVVRKMTHLKMINDITKNKMRFTKGNR